MPRNRFERPRPQRALRNLYIVATEGEKTEKRYFDEFNNDEFRKNIQVRVLPAQRGASAPQQVLKRLQKFVRTQDVREGDELWVVVDVDSWGEHALDNLCQQCARLGFSVAVSNPCFELWLVLHQEKPPIPQKNKDCERELERLLGHYDKADYDVRKLLQHVSLAIKNAQQRDHDQEETWPHSPGTHVYKMVKKLIQ